MRPGPGGVPEAGSGEQLNIIYHFAEYYAQWSRRWRPEKKGGQPFFSSSREQTTLPLLL
jgi:hypothetical protein